MLKTHWVLFKSDFNEALGGLGFTKELFYGKTLWIPILSFSLSLFLVYFCLLADCIHSFDSDRFSFLFSIIFSWVVSVGWNFLASANLV